MPATVPTHRRTAVDDAQQVNGKAAEPDGTVTWLRDEEAAGSNPATPTTELHVAACFRNQFRLPRLAGSRSWE